MTSILTRAQVREVDRRAIQEYGISGLVLMENAGRGTTDVLCRLLFSEPSPPAGEGRVRGAEKKVVIVCGKGNNGGDGFVIARHLDLRGNPVRVLLLSDPNDLTGDAATNYQIIEKAGLRITAFIGGVARSESAKGVMAPPTPLSGRATQPFDARHFSAELTGAAWLVDALLGTGATGEPKSPLAEAIDRMNASGIPILAVDLPSGLDCDTGTVSKHTIRAAHTCTFVAAKPGFFTPGANQYVGQLHVLDIGVPRKLIEELI
jgi:NAD(P)H-hydrate epimerase